MFFQKDHAAFMQCQVIVAQAQIALLLYQLSSRDTAVVMADEPPRHEDPDLITEKHLQAITEFMQLWWPTHFEQKHPCSNCEYYKGWLSSNPHTEFRYRRLQTHRWQGNNFYCEHCYHYTKKNLEWRPRPDITQRIVELKNAHAQREAQEEALQSNTTKAIQYSAAIQRDTTKAPPIKAPEAKPPPPSASSSSSITKMPPLPGLRPPPPPPPPVSEDPQTDRIRLMQEEMEKIHAEMGKFRAEIAELQVAVNHNTEVLRQLVSRIDQYIFLEVDRVASETREDRWQ